MEQMIMLVYFDMQETVPEVVCVGPFKSREDAHREAIACSDVPRQYWMVEVAPPMVTVH